MTDDLEPTGHLEECCYEHLGIMAHPKKFQKEQLLPKMPQTPRAALQPTNELL
jgi:hypothetical protein